MHCKKTALMAEGMEIEGVKPRQGAEVEDSDSSTGVWMADAE